MEHTEKICTVCKELKPLSKFHKWKSSKDGRMSMCGSCSCKKHKHYSETCPGFKDARKRTTLGIYYNMTLEEYNELFEKQEGCCAICGRHQSELKKSLSVDHDHNTGKIRGLLCNKCNTGLGHFNDDEKMVTLALVYISNNK